MQWNADGRKRGGRGGRGGWETAVSSVSCIFVDAALRKKGWRDEKNVLKETGRDDLRRILLRRKKVNLDNERAKGDGKALQQVSGGKLR